MFEVGYDTAGDVTVCRLKGDLDATSASDFREASAGLVGAGQVVIDLAGVPFIDSSGLGALIGAVRRIRDCGGHVALCSSRGPISRLLRCTGLDRVVPIVSQLSEAQVLLAAELAAQGAVPAR